MFKKFLVSLALLGHATSATATTIAFDGKEMAADSQMTVGSWMMFTPEKLTRIDGDVIGCAGNCEEIVKFKIWYRDRTRPFPKMKGSFEAICWTKDGLMRYTTSGVPIKFNPPYALGSGSDIAMGAMKAGVGARRAVEIATETDIYSGGHVFTMTRDPQQCGKSPRH